MNTHFKSALTKIEAEDEIVEKTEKYLRTKLENPNQGEIINLNRKSRQMKKILVACVAAVFVIGAFISGYAYLKTPVAYISLDINPSVELGVNALNNVVTVEGVNQDGQAILEGKNIINTDIKDALDQLINSATKKSYINHDGTTVVSITAESNNQRKALDLTNIGEQAVNNSMTKNKVNAIVYRDCSDLSLRKEARKLGVSPGKLKLIKSLQALDPTITVEQFKDSKVSDIMLKVNELMNTIDTDNDESELDDSQKEAIKNLKNVAKKAEKRVKDAAKAKLKAIKEQTKTELKEIREQTKAELKEIREQAKAEFKDAKEQAKAIRNQAKIKAKELKEQAKALLKNTRGLTEQEIDYLKARAEELRKQADALINDAEKQVEELKDTSEKQNNEAVEAAEKSKISSEIQDDDNKSTKEEKKTEQIRKREEKKSEVAEKES
jgi:hypothetical protein